MSLFGGRVTHNVSVERGVLFGSRSVRQLPSCTGVLAMSMPRAKGTDSYRNICSTMNNPTMTKEELLATLQTSELFRSHTRRLRMLCVTLCVKKFVNRDFGFFVFVIGLCSTLAKFYFGPSSTLAKFCLGQVLLWPSST